MAEFAPAGTELTDAMRARGAVVLTPPVEYDWEVRRFFPDPDGESKAAERS